MVETRVGTLVRTGMCAGLAAVLAAAGLVSADDVAAQAQEPVVSVGTATVVEAFARVEWLQALVPVTLDHPAPARCHRRVATADGTARGSCDSPC